VRKPGSTTIRNKSQEDVSLYGDEQKKNELIFVIKKEKKKPKPPNLGRRKKEPKAPGEEGP